MPTRSQAWDEGQRGSLLVYKSEHDVMTEMAKTHNTLILYKLTKYFSEVKKITTSLRQKPTEAKSSQYKAVKKYKKIRLSNYIF